MKENTPKNIGVPVKSLLFSLKSAVFFKSFNQTVTFGQIIDRADSGFLSLTSRTIDLPGLTGAVAAGENAFDACFSLVVDKNRTAAHLQTRQKAVERIRSTEHKDCLDTEKFTSGMQPGYSVGTGNISRLIQDHRYIFAFWSYEALKTGNKITSLQISARYSISSIASGTVAIAATRLPLYSAPSTLAQ